MKSTSLRKKLLLATSLLGSVGAIALPVGLLSAFAPTAAMAQDYTSGTLVGRVTSSSGAPVTGAAVTVRSASTGITQNSVTDSTGSFRAPLIPTGSYDVSIRKAGFTDIAQSGIAVRAGSESNYGFTLTTPDDLEAVVVVAKKANSQLDFSQTTTGLSVDVVELTKQVPVGRSAQALALLAPGAIQGAAGNYAGQTAIGGGSVSENAFYINGLNITNFNTYLGGATVPFDFYKTFEVKTGGYPAEYGRATGGVINATTKSGTNDLYFAVHGNYEPKDLRAPARDTYLSKGVRTDREAKDVSVEVGLPLWRDHLFFYGLVDFRSVETSSATKTTTARIATEGVNGTQKYNTTETNQPFYGAKLDGYITSRQHLEATYFRTNDVQKNRSYNYNQFTNTVGSFASGTNLPIGGENYVFKYTGTFTDWLTISGAYGRSKDNLASLPLNAVDPVVTDTRTGSTALISQQGSSTLSSPYRTKRTFYRADADLYFNFLGKHHVRAGYDHEDDELTHFSVYTGGVSYDYKTFTAATATGFGLPATFAGTQYIEARTFINGGVFDGQNEALYIQDNWNLGHGLTLDVGVRTDSFQQGGVNQGTTKGAVFIDLKDNIAPRVGLTFDPFGNGRDKFFANYGKYFLPVASNTAYRQAAGTFDFTSRYYNTAGYTPNATTGLPNGGLGTQLVGYTGARACVAGGASAAGVIGCTYQNDGSFYTADQQTSKELSATEEDEFIIGYSHKFNNLWSASATVTYRNLVKGADDVAIDYAVRNYCAQKGLSLAAGGGCDNYDGTLNDYAIINPGSPATVKLQVPLSSKSTALPTLTFSAADLGYPKIEREYAALDLAIDRAFDGKWAFHGTYTLSQLRGNYEGSSYSDYASGQTDSGITLQYDTPTLVQGAYGLLPNHHAHVFKAYGSYQLLPNLLIGANSTIISPRAVGCIGFNPNDIVLQNNYGPSFAHYCGGKLVPEGTAFSTPWAYNVDVSLRYSVPKMFRYQGGLVLRMDVFNILNQQTVVNVQNQAENGGILYTAPATGTTETRVPVFGKATTYQTPRVVRFGFDWAF